MRLKVAVLIMLVVASALAQSNQPNQKGMGHDDSALRPTFPKLPDANPEMVEIAIEDQWDRGNDMFGDKNKTATTVLINIAPLAPANYLKGGPIPYLVVAGVWDIGHALKARSECTASVYGR